MRHEVVAGLTAAFGESLSGHHDSPPQLLSFRHQFNAPGYGFPLVQSDHHRVHRLLFVVPVIGEGKSDLCVRVSAYTVAGVSG